MFHCVGCGGSIPWDGKGMFSYTCPCGATIFAEENLRRLSVPTSLILNLARGVSLPHLDDLVGTSHHASEEKEAVTVALQLRGFTWMKDCPECQRDGTLERRRKREEYQRAMEETLARARLGELTYEKAIGLT